MYGQIHVVVKSLILEKFGEDTWEKIMTVSGCDPLAHFMVFHVYEDTLTYALIGAVSQVLEVPLEAVLEIFGEYFVLYCLKHGYDKMLWTLGKDLESFIQNLDSLHALLAMSYNNIDAPSFRCETRDDGNLTLHYYSVRPGLYPIVVGMLRSVGKEIFKEDVTVELLSQSQESRADQRPLHHTAFLVKILYSETPGMHLAETTRTKPTIDVTFDMDAPVISGKTFCSLFPFHVIFGKNLHILQWGANIGRMSGQSLRPGLPLKNVFNLVQPSIILSYENVIRFINAVYILEIAACAVNNHCSPEIKRGLILKGQMIAVDGTGNIIFIGSPRLADLNELLERKVYLSDIPLYDATRELVLLNQQRIAEIEVSKKLDETTAVLRRTSQALEEEKAKTDMLLYQMLPMKVANALREGHQVEAEKFEEVTILFSDIVTFTNIAAAVSPIEVVDMLNQLYRRFDDLSTEHGVYKVETIGDAYMVVGGVPVPSTTHAQCVANMGLGMLRRSEEVKSPATLNPLEIRVGIHTGPVVAGVVGAKMPRYCLFGDTVNTASRMESHGSPGHIHVSSTTHASLDGTDFELIPRGNVDIKGKGKMMTYFLVSNQKIIGNDQRAPEESFVPQRSALEPQLAEDATDLKKREKASQSDSKPDIVTISQTCILL